MRLTIFKRLTLGYLAIMVLVLSSGIFVTVQLNRLNRLAHDAIGVDGESIRVAEGLLDRTITLVSLDKKFWISGDRDFQDLFIKRSAEFTGEVGRLEGLQPTESVARIRSLSNDYFALFRMQTETDSRRPISTYETRRDALNEELGHAIRQVVQNADAARDDKIRQSGVISTHVMRVTAGSAVLCILTGLAVSLHTARRIVRPILMLQRKTREIAEGRFETLQGVAAPPEIRELTDDFNLMSARLKELETLKEDFVSHVSHTLRTPLTAIREASGMLQEGIFDRSPQNHARLLSIVQTECERLIVSVNRILDLSRMEARMMDYRFQETDLMELVRQVTHKLGPIADRKSIRIDAAPGAEIPRVCADPEQILQLLENLIGNALKFTETNGSISIRVIATPGARREVQVSVSDTGCGIAVEHLERIFDKFRRIEDRKDTSRGTGLGLAIAKHIVAAHGGRIWVDSTAGSGSTFSFTLPVYSSSSCSQADAGT
ncbi:MAG: sensor histidine kinase [Desulfobacterales bacterium]